MCGTLVMDWSSRRGRGSPGSAPPNRANSSSGHPLAERSRWFVGSSRIIRSRSWKSTRMRSTRRLWRPRAVDASRRSSWRRPRPSAENGPSPIRPRSRRGLELLLEVREQLDVLLRGVVGHRGTAVPSASSSTSRPRAEECEKRMGSSPRPAGTGACGRYRADRGVGRCHGGAAGQRLPAQPRDEQRLPVSVALDQSHLLTGTHDEGGVGQQRTVTDFDGEG